MKNKKYFSPAVEPSFSAILGLVQVIAAYLCRVSASEDLRDNHCANNLCLYCLSSFPKRARIFALVSGIKRGWRPTDFTARSHRAGKLLHLFV
jgi:hypothetical protein